jgi:hypothetical protein
MEVRGTVRLSSKSVLIGRDSTIAVATDTTRKPITFFQLPSINPNDEKYHMYLNKSLLVNKGIDRVFFL